MRPTCSDWDALGTLVGYSAAKKGFTVTVNFYKIDFFSNCCLNLNMGRWKNFENGFANIDLALYSISVLHRPRSIMAKEGLVLLRILKMSSVPKVFIHNASLTKFLNKRIQKSWDNHNDLAGADTEIILQPLLDFSGTSLGCPILLAEYPRIIPRMLVCYEGCS